MTSGDRLSPTEALVLSVPGMSCRHCARAVSARVADVAGVVAVEADVASRTVLVHGHARPTHLVDAVGGAGHQVVAVQPAPIPSSPDRGGRPMPATPPAPSDTFPTDTTGLPLATRPEELRLADGDTLRLRIGPVAKPIGADVVRMLAYNGSIPGPCLRVDQGAEITVEVTNDGDIENTVHWHGLRLENRYDGVPHETQRPIPPGGTFSYRVQFPDAGFYWYHPHVREDYGLESGLYGTIVVEPADASYWPAADRHLTVTLDDALVEDGHLAPFPTTGPTHTAMGRYGNVMLVGGETQLSARAAAGEVVRLYLVNTANTRIFNVALPGAQMKLVGGDSGRYESDTFVDQVLLAPSERAVVDVLFATPGDVALEHRMPGKTIVLGTFSVEGAGAGTAASSYDSLGGDAPLAAERRALWRELEREPDRVLGFTALMPLLYAVEDTGATSYVCPMHPEVVSPVPATCPKCAMKLIPAGDAGAAGHGEGHGHGEADSDDGLEWEDLMPDINRRTDPSNMIWKIVDRRTGAENEAISWTFATGDRVKIRLINEIEGSEHPMHHPFHIHGAGRFLVLSRDGAVEPNLVWKDTVLVPAGQTVDILFEVTNRGRWMAHCHIAEHNQSGMMFNFDVTEGAS